MKFIFYTILYVGIPCIVIYWGVHGGWTSAATISIIAWVISAFWILGELNDLRRHRIDEAAEPIIDKVREDALKEANKKIADAQREADIAAMEKARAWKANTAANMAAVAEERKQLLIKEVDDHLKDLETAHRWIAPIVADIKMYYEERRRNPADLIAAKRPYDTQVRVNILKKEKRDLVEENTILKYRLEYIRTLIPETDDIVERDEYSAETESADSPSKFLSKDEFQLLSDREKNERALEYYKNRNKKNWEIGRDFERFIGWKYEQDGYEVEYFGIEQRLNDLGRDLIARKPDRTLIIQCKYWSRDTVIHEKHIAQLYGTVIMYELDHPLETVRGIFITHTALSDMAKRFAERLSIKVKENMDRGEYPLIKCNIGRDGERIYHLPMDQQYDTVKIEENKGEIYALTVAEAESKGFRRAYRWHGDL